MGLILLIVLIVLLLGCCASLAPCQKLGIRTQRNSRGRAGDLVSCSASGLSALGVLIAAKI